MVEFTFISPEIPDPIMCSRFLIFLGDVTISPSLCGGDSKQVCRTALRL